MGAYELREMLIKLEERKRITAAARKKDCHLARILAVAGIGRSLAPGNDSQKASLSSIGKDRLAWGKGADRRLIRQTWDGILRYSPPDSNFVQSLVPESAHIIRRSALGCPIGGYIHYAGIEAMLEFVGYHPLPSHLPPE